MNSAQFSSGGYFLLFFFFKFLFFNKMKDVFGQCWRWILSESKIASKDAYKSLIKRHNQIFHEVDYLVATLYIPFENSQVMYIMSTGN